MDMVYYEQPAFVLFPILLLSWQVFCYWLRKELPLSALVDVALTGIGVVGHAVAISVILLNDGTLSDVLLLALLSGALSLFLSPKPNQTDNMTEEE